MKKAPDVFFLQKTCLNARPWVFCKYKLGFTNCFVVDSVGRGGGLALFWKDDCDLIMLNYSMNHIHASINDSSFEGGEGLIMGVYGHPQIDRRDEVWSLIKSLSVGVNFPWLVFEDFNEILNQLEKYGGNYRSERQMANFRVVLDKGDFRT